MNTPVYDVPLDANGIQHFSYQVAGHGALLKLGDGKICKPVIPIELNFYQSVHNYPTLLPYTATFHGTVDIKMSKDEVNEFMDQLDVLSAKTPKPCKDNPEVMNPWSAKVCKAQFNEFTSNQNSILKYLVLEDLTSKFNFPCICDIKMGTRQDGDDTPPDKKLRHQKKVNTTTSLPLGIRMCGTQVYNVLEKKYEYTSKFDGRKLTQDTIQSALELYYFDGSKYRVDILHQMLNRLREFYQAAKSVDDKFRFYSTSILFLYEGDPEVTNPSILKNIYYLLL